MNEDRLIDVYRKRGVSMKCPNCDIELTKDTQRVDFQDVDDNHITIKVTAEWCSECGYVHCVY